MAGNRITVELKGPVPARLGTLVRETGRNQSEVVNSAIRLLRYVEEELHKGRDLVIRDQDGKEESLRMPLI